VANVIDANWRAATHPNAVAQVFNIGCGQQTSLNQLLDELNRVMGTQYQASYEPGRAGDVRHSVADVGKAARLLGYAPKVTLRDGLKQVLEWYRKQLSAPTVGS
jgi:nucleoside-diphosphate-sugar epimerase